LTLPVQPDRLLQELTYCSPCRSIRHIEYFQFLPLSVVQESNAFAYSQLPSLWLQVRDIAMNAARFGRKM
jgi:hypothetical protein